MLGRYKRRSAELDEAITSAYVQGVSTRKMGKVTRALMGEAVSRSTVSRVTRTLEEKVEALRTQPLIQAFPFLYRAPHPERARQGPLEAAWAPGHGIFEAPNLQDARERLEALEQELGCHLPEPMECLREGFAAICFFAFPKAHWKRLRSTNGLERLHGEVKRRIRGVGAFPDRASALRLIIAVALEVTGVRDDRRYLDMSLLKSTPDTAVA
ncbi:transposase [Corallococcus macrosporus DSM 14697]|uniref:Mutator family transposase n=1 Tax=Corallococcus macrosporus DSM 14697 TaxID=1189310 RepID=A0A250JPV0_9BACT|nr:transposase [Corallococcus macrosporus DSM 14697]